MSRYTIGIGAAFLVGVVVARWRTGRPWGHLLDRHLAAAIAAIVLGRVGYVLTHLDYFAEHGAEIVDLVRTPGLHGLTALVGAAAVGAVLRSLPALAPTICFVGAAASLGCIPLGCGAGREVFWTDGALLWALRVDWPDATLTRNPRLPAQLFAAAWLAACSALSLRWPGWALAAAAMGAALTYAESLI